MTQINTPNKKASKNHIINGYFDVWQRGETFAKGEGARYTADRWNAGDLATIDKYQLNEAEQEALDLEEITNALKITFNEASSGEEIIYHRIEDVRTLSGKSSILRFLAWAENNAYINKINIKQNFGVGGSPETVTTLLSYPPSLTSTKQEFLLPVDIPSVVGKTIGDDSYLEIEIKLGIRGGIQDIFYFTGFELYPAGRATPIRKNYDEELINCLRYYEQIDGIDSWPEEKAIIQNFNLKRDVPTVSCSVTGIDFPDISRRYVAIVTYAAKSYFKVFLEAEL